MIIQKAENKYIWNCRPWLLPDSLIAALKRHIEVDKSLLRKNINYRPLYLERVNITHVVAYHGNSHFLKWLIKVGANPTIRAKNYHHEAAHDVIQLMAEKGDVNFLRYLLKRFGAQLFYNKDKSGVMRPQWWRFEGIISHKKMQVALFLIDEVGYGKHLDSQPFDSFSNSIPLIKRILFSHAHIDDFNYFDYFDSSQRNTGEAEKKALKMLNLLLNQENISSDKLYFGIQTLLCVIEKPSLMHIDWKYYNYATRNLLIQLIDRIHIQPGELKKISSVARQKMKSTNFNNPRAACIWAIYCTTLNHGKNEILQKLQAASGLPIPHYDVRNNILKHVFFGRGESYPSDVIRKAAKHDDLDTLLFLIDLDRFGSLQTTYEFKTGRTKFEGYTPLHLACEDGRQDLALQLIKKMKAKGGSFDAIAHSNEEGTCYASYYSSLHLAIEEGITQVAVSLIEAGADIHLKGIRYKPSGFCSIFAECQEETALQMAIRKRQPQVIRSLQRAMLKDYIKQREEESEYLSQVSLFGFVLFSLGSINLCGLVLGFGNHSKTAKLQKAYEFRELLSRGELNEDALENFNDDVSQEGRLGQIIQLSHHYLTRSISLNNPLRI